MPDDPPPDGRPWGLLSSQGQVLVRIAQQPAITVRRLADATGYAERRMAQCIADLEHAGMLRHARVGRHNIYQVLPASARLPWSPQRTIAEVLETLASAPVTAPSHPRGSATSAAAPPGAPEDA